ncbi:MAG: ABC transporter ATP-binding protein, partial [Pyrinomonadaceae bacterium]
ILLSVRNVTKTYDEFKAVDNLSLDVRRGRIFGLIGPNGAGKTSTIRMIVNITAPDDGVIELFGKRIDSALQDRIGYLPEERGLYKSMKVAEQLRYFGELKGMSSATIDKQIDRWLQRMKLTDWKQKKSDELSKGMQQKIQFIITVIHDPDLIILDEPFSGLDPVNVDLISSIIRELKGHGKAIIFSTHLMEQAEKLCDDICLINRSRKVLEGTLPEIKQRFHTNRIALRTNSADGLINDPTLVASIEQHAGYVELVLAPGCEAQDFLRRLIANSVSVERFELVEPSLHDIFVAMVSEDGTHRLEERLEEVSAS